METLRVMRYKNTYVLTLIKKIHFGKWGLTKFITFILYIFQSKQCSLLFNKRDILYMNLNILTSINLNNVILMGMEFLATYGSFAVARLFTGQR